MCPIFYPDVDSRKTIVTMDVLLFIPEESVLIPHVGPPLTKFESSAKKLQTDKVHIYIGTLDYTAN